jgi:hypothetical protein
MSALHRFLNRPGGLVAASVLLALLVSSILGFGLFLVVPSVVAWLSRRAT